MDTQKLPLNNGVPSFYSVCDDLKEASYLLSLVEVLGGEGNRTPTVFHTLAMWQALCQALYNSLSQPILRTPCVVSATSLINRGGD